MKITVIYGSETGNAEGLAELAIQRLQTHGLEGELINMGDINAGQLAEHPRLVVITSTWGDGDPPSNAWALWEELAKKPSVDLSAVQYAVCGIGDSSYPQFCKCGNDFDEWLAELGARRFHDRASLDLDFEQPFETWLAEVIAKLNTLAPATV